MIVVFFWINYVITFIKYENLRLINKKIVLQEELSIVMDNLDEVILTKSTQGLNFCNKNGFKILQNIYNVMQMQLQ